MKALAIRCGLAAFLLLAGSAWAVPAHYIVFEFDADGRATPVFHAQVEMAADPSVGELPRLVSDTEVERIGYRAVKNGIIGALRQIEVPRFLRAEFANDADPHDATIVHHSNIENTQRAFVLRIALDAADSVDLETDAGVQRIDLTALAAHAASLPLAATALAKVDPAQVHAIEGSGAAGSPANRVDILVLGEGYTAAEQSAFDSHTTTLQNAMFNVTPYREYANFVNWRTGFVVSEQSGADHPVYQAGCTTASCCTDPAAQNDPHAGMFVNTAFDGRYCSYNIHRLLTVSDSKIYAAAAGYPDWDAILVTVNDPVYGGAGGAFSVTSAHAEAPKVVIHEYGHSFHRLADEYDSPYPGYPSCSDFPAPGLGPCEANVTNQTVPDLIKWRSWFTSGIAIPTPSGTAGTGLFQGARYQIFDMYRPVFNTCLMRSLITTFCPVCRQEYVKRLYRGGFGSPSGGIDLIEPGSEWPRPATPVRYAINTTRMFSADILTPAIGSVGIQWFLDGSPIGGANAASYAFSQASQTPATRTLQLRVADQTAFVNAAMADGLLVHTRSWTIQVDNDRLFADGFE